MKAALERITLHESDTVCEPIERFAVSAPVRPSLDVEELTYEALDARRAALIVGYSLELAPRNGDEALSYVFASFRLYYSMPAPLDPAERREFAATRALADAWPYWLEFLASAHTRMGLDPLRLPATPPPRLTEIALEAFDVSLQVSASRSGSIRAVQELDAVRASLPRDEVMVFDALWPILSKLNEAKRQLTAANRKARESRSGQSLARARTARDAATHWQQRIDEIWVSADSRVLGRLVERLTTPAGRPIAAVELVELRDPEAVAQLRTARNRAAHERAVQRVVELARAQTGPRRVESVDPGGPPEFRAWATTPDRLAVEIEGEVWNAVPLDDETVLAARTL